LAMVAVDDEEEEEEQEEEEQEEEDVEHAAESPRAAALRHDKRRHSTTAQPRTTSAKRLDSCSPTPQLQQRQAGPGQEEEHGHTVGRRAQAAAGDDAAEDASPVLEPVPERPGDADCRLFAHLLPGLTLQKGSINAAAAAAVQAGEIRRDNGTACWLQLFAWMRWHLVACLHVHVVLLMLSCTEVRPGCDCGPHTLHSQPASDAPTPLFPAAFLVLWCRPGGCVQGGGAVRAGAHEAGAGGRQARGVLLPAGCGAGGESAVGSLGALRLDVRRLGLCGGWLRACCLLPATCCLLPAAVWLHGFSHGCQVQAGGHHSSGTCDGRCSCRSAEGWLHGPFPTNTAVPPSCMCCAPSPPSVLTKGGGGVRAPVDCGCSVSKDRGSSSDPAGRPAEPQPGGGAKGAVQQVVVARRLVLL
jgi:hypothetical protein